MAMFQDRAEAGFLLAEQLSQKEIPLTESIVVGIPRGGIVVASIVASILGIAVFPLPIKKITVPEMEELAVGALSYGDIVYWDLKTVSEYKLAKSDLALLLRKATKPFKERCSLLKKYMKLPILKRKTVILVDDGVATGASVKAAALSLKKLGAKRIILAVPVIAEPVYNELLPAFSDIVALTIADELFSVGQFYETFEQISDDEVLEILSSK